MDRKIVPFRKPVQPVTDTSVRFGGDDEDAWTTVSIPQAQAVQSRSVY